MEVRDAIEADAERLASITGTPTDVMRNLVHDRTVRVAVSDDAAGGAARPADQDERANGGASENRDGDAEGDAPDDDDIEGFVSFDAKRDTVHVTQLEGDRDTCARLLEEPIRFADNESMAVELLVAGDDEAARAAAESVGFSEDGPGPRFGGTPTVRYRR